MTQPTDPIQYAKYLRTGNVIELGNNRYEVKSGSFENAIPGDDRSLFFVIELELISVNSIPAGAMAPRHQKAVLKVDPRTIIPVIE